MTKEIIDMLTKNHAAQKLPNPCHNFSNQLCAPDKSNQISWFTCDDIMVNILVVNNKGISLYWKL